MLYEAYEAFGDDHCISSGAERERSGCSLFISFPVRLFMTIDVVRLGGKVLAVGIRQVISFHESRTVRVHFSPRDSPDS